MYNIVILHYISNQHLGIQAHQQELFYLVSIQAHSPIAQYVPEPWRDSDRFEVPQEYCQAVQAAIRNQEEDDFLEDYAASPPQSQAASDTSAAQSLHTAARSATSTAAAKGQQQSAANVLSPNCDSSAVSRTQPTPAVAGAPSAALVHICSLDKWVHQARERPASSQRLQGEPAALRMSGCPLYT